MTQQEILERLRGGAPLPRRKVLVLNKEEVMDHLRRGVRWAREKIARQQHNQRIPSCWDGARFN